MKPITSLLCALAVAAGVAGCTDDTPPYNVVDKFRLLALAADPPAIVTGQSSTLSALVTEPDATYQWSWCPLYRNSDYGFECLVTTEELQAAVDEATGGMGPAVPSLDLGTDPTAIFDYSFPPDAAQGLCALLLQRDLDPTVQPPDCFDDAFVIRIRLETESGNELIIGVRDLPLLYDSAAVVNQIPQLTQITAMAPGGSPVVIEPDGSTVLDRDTEYELRIDTAIDSAEIFVGEDDDGNPQDKREQLIASWFIEGGDLDRSRSGFIDEDNDVERLVVNEWKPPAEAEISANQTRLWVVLRDNRDATTWIERTVMLGGGP